MSMIVIGLMKDAHEARGAVRTLEAGGFELEDIDAVGVLSELLLKCGVPEHEAALYAEGARRGAMLVMVRAHDEDEAAEAAQLMAEHGALDLDACATAWQSQPDAAVDEYARELGEYPAAPARIYPDVRSSAGT